MIINRLWVNNILLNNPSYCSGMYVKAKKRNENNESDHDLFLLLFSKKKAPSEDEALKIWCSRKDLNLHTLRHQILSLACIPISPHPRKGREGTQEIAEIEPLSGIAEILAVGLHAERVGGSNLRRDEVRFGGLRDAPGLGRTGG